MTIGVCSDTHSMVLPKKMLDAFKGVDLIVHCGDICDEELLNQLKKIKPVKAVQGNMDEPSLRKKLPLKEKFEVEGVKVGVYHGHGATRDALGNARDQFFHDSVDLILFGHSHKPFNERAGSVTFFNPGSPNDVVRAPYFSYGLINVSKGNFAARIVKI